MPQIMKYDLPPARESRLRMPPGCKVLGAAVLQGISEQVSMSPSGKPMVEQRPGVSLSLLVEYPDVVGEKIPRRLFIVGVGENVPEEAAGFDVVGVTAIGPRALALYLEPEKLISLVTP